MANKKVSCIQWTPFIVATNGEESFGHYRGVVSSQSLIVAWFWRPLPTCTRFWKQWAESTLPRLIGVAKANDLKHSKLSFLANIDGFLCIRVAQMSRSRDHEIYVLWFSKGFLGLRPLNSTTLRVQHPYTIVQLTCTMIPQTRQLSPRVYETSRVHGVCTSSFSFEVWLHRSTSANNWSLVHRFGGNISWAYITKSWSMHVHLPLNFNKAIQRWLYRLCWWIVNFSNMLWDSWYSIWRLVR
jgi:hypothetical protein